MIDTFDRRAWWINVKEKLPHFFAVLRAVLTHAPNSCPPERVFSILNDTFDNDQSRITLILVYWVNLTNPNDVWMPYLFEKN